ncbi:hypothetical protein P8S55_06840 [Halomonas sp. M1]|uniref:hypothetical protein n=1 Tax=Halomonas sp. M1 TaxID=3035470 RepID=UPI0024867080|nr:hypothetical protein [Halomonas sp. M1]WFE72805.1 hypothetical protein P8S55_06840 [Halomonas sp. M1]
MQVAAAVGVPVKRGQVAELAGLERVGSRQAVLPCPSAPFSAFTVSLLFADYPLGMGIAERDLAVFVGLLAGPCCSNEYCPCGSVGGTLYA